MNGVLAAFSIATMSLDEKVGQLLMAHFQGEQINQEACDLIHEAHVGGIIYYNWANGLQNPEQVKLLSQALQKEAKIPLLIAADQEGGLVNRVQGLTSFPGNKAIGMTGHPEWAAEAAQVIGEELLSTGVNMNLAPVVDINSEPRNPVIGIRSFGDNAEIVMECASQALQGYNKAGMITTLKHYPGHGEAKVDSHVDLPVIYKTLEELEACELLPFKTLQADAIMTAHLLVPALDPDNCSTLSKPTLDYLRKNFQGVIITDSLVMGGVLNPSTTIEEVAKRAFLAGSDILLLGGKHLAGSSTELTPKDVIRVHKYLVKAVQNKEISEERINSSVERILNLKRKRQAEAYQGDRIELADKIASKAIRVVERKKVDLSGKIVYYYHDKLPEAPESADVSIIFTNNAWKNPTQTAFINKLKKPYIIVALRDPLDADYFPEASCVIMTYSPSQPSINAVLRLLKNKN